MCMCVFFKFDFICVRIMSLYTQMYARVLKMIEND